MSAAAAVTTAPGPWTLGSVTLTATVDAVRAVIADPGSNPTLSLLVLACIALVVILLAVFVLMLVTPSRKRVVKIRRYYGTREAGAPAAASPDAGPPPRRSMSRQTSSIVIGALVAAAVLGGYAATSTDYYCGQTCHGGSEFVGQADAVDHAACVSCHEGSILSVLPNVAARGRMLARYAAGTSPEVARIAADSTACLRCHRAVRKEAVVSDSTGVRMSHEEVVTGGLPCRECHAGSGHGGAPFTATMSACLPCHDARTASAECESCHTRDPSAIALGEVPAPGSGDRSFGSGKYEYPAVRAAKRECGGCHDEPATCDPCHGMRMPHSAAFKEGGHARTAAFALKRSCWRCHDPSECGASGCHAGAFDPVSGNTSHGQNWKAEHARSAWTGGCVCHSGRGDRGAKSMCTLCHAADHSLLPPLER